MPKVSIIVPVYNVETYLEKCLMSLVNQTLQDIEIIVINDGSTDKSGEIAEKIASIYSDKVTVYHQENSGVSSARNFGLSIANGEYIGFVDSDDYVETTMFEKMYNKAIEKKFDIVVCDANLIYPKEDKFVSSGLDNDYLGKENLFVSLINSYTIVWNKIYRKDLLENILFRENYWYEDVDFLYKLYPIINSVGVVKYPLYNYVQRQNSITYTFNKKLYHIIEIFDGIIDYYKKNNYYEKYSDEIEYSYVRYLYGTFIRRLAKSKEYKTYIEGVNFVLQKVKNTFPNYRKNKYLKMKKPKSIYLKNFNKIIALIIYFIEKNKMN